MANLEHPLEDGMLRDSRKGLIRNSQREPRLQCQSVPAYYAYNSAFFFSVRIPWIGSKRLQNNKIKKKISVKRNFGDHLIQHTTYCKNSLWEKEQK